jgi:2-polyprenyl-3-methyl-5-hydroxy-6-metoxy-1,4-benzoquinol methylase
MPQPRSKPAPPSSIRPQYDELGVTGFYASSGATYRNPHEAIIRRLLHQVCLEWDCDLSNVLDLACGSGEVTLALRELGATVSGIDPFTGEAYLERTGLQAEALSFDDICAGSLEGRRYSLIVCSFALHLADPSKLPVLSHQLARVSPALLILTPHKRPALKLEWGWEMVRETMLERVRARLYGSRVDVE